jgi:periplasmic divalent cation tolerance protein
MKELIELRTTTASKEDALRIANALLEQRLAACVQIDGPIDSIYRWQGRVETAQEWRVTAKTSDRLLQRVCAEVQQMHGYECPELIATPISGGSTDYLDWLRQQLDQ